MTSQSDDDVIGATSNLSEDTCQSIIFHIWGRSCLYLIRCCLNNSHKMCAKISCIYQGAGKRPRQCSPNGPKSNKTATRGPEGPESGLNKRVRGPKGPEDEQSLVFVSALASATICFSRFSQKSRFSWHNLSTLMTAKMHENFSRVSYLQHEHRVKKSKQFVDWVKSYAKLKFRKNAAFVSKSRPSR